jgi:hypothetical protein
MRHIRSLSRVAVLVLGVLGLAVHAPVAAGLTLSVFTNPHPVVSGGTIGFAYAGNKFVGSVQADGFNVLYSTDLTGGNVQVFAPTVSIPGGSVASEHFVASSLGLGGFPSRDVYVAAANGIIHIDNAGTSGNTFVTGLASPVRGILFDAIGTFGGDMLVTTFGGQIYRVNSAGTAALLASVGEDTEGMDIAPLGAGFAGHDGELIVASEGSGLLRAITTAGVVTALNPGNPIPSAEELTFVPLNLGASGDPVEGFYGSNYTPNVVKGDVSQFTGFLGDVIVTGEVTHLVHRVHWNGTSFEITTLGSFPNQPEDGIFVTAAIINPGQTLTGLSPAKVYVGLTNSDDVGLYFDLFAEVLVNGNVVGSGEVDKVWGGSSGFNNAVKSTIQLILPNPVAFPPGSQLSIRVSVRQACTAPRERYCVHANECKARLWYNDREADSSFDATIDGVNGGNSADYFLLTNFQLGTAPGPGPKKTSDVGVGKRCSPFKPFGTWSITIN